MANVHLGSSAGTSRVDPGLPLTPALWIFVVLAMLGSILALALWLVIYRQQGSSSGTSGENDDKCCSIILKQIESSQPGWRMGGVGWGGGVGGAGWCG